MQEVLVKPKEYVS